MIIDILIFIFGLIVGSFLNCVIYRLEENKSFLKGRSFCPDCKHNLAWNDLIPVFSFLFLKGKCRYCSASISWQYPIVEIFTALIFLFIFIQFPPADFLFLSVIASLLIITFVIDLKHFIIPDKVIFPAAVVAFAYNLFKNYGNFPNFIYSAFLASGFFLLIFIFSRGKWIGFGDVKFAFFMGLFLGFPNTAVALYFAFIIGAIIGIGLIIIGKKRMKSEVPFGPFLIIGTFIALFLGDRIINWYLTLFL